MVFRSEGSNAVFTRPGATCPKSLLGLVECESYFFLAWMWFRESIPGPLENDCEVSPGPLFSRGTGINPLEHFWAQIGF